MAFACSTDTLLRLGANTRPMASAPASAAARAASGVV